ncbi:MAG: Fe2+/Zn2+ uptake regulation protein [Gammaproteobacteria bacterium]|jgi:Fur family zinc uptake transcriptional regulator|nr:Fe2+/Zn2+ uptake regulation protein [Gammaproteobacteria bacterium]
MKTAEQRLNEALQYCVTQGLKLTTLRQTILTILYEQANPLSAYDILRILKLTHPKAEAMTVYRILNFLEQNHLIHRITSCNTYAACDMLMHEHHAQLLLCERCGYAEEIEIKQLESAVQTTLKQYHFKASAKPTEIFGICEGCQATAN